MFKVMHPCFRERGALLLEVLLGLGLFVTALLFSFGVFPNSARATTQSRNYTLARAIAREFLEEELTRAYGTYSTADVLTQRVITNDGVVIAKDFRVEFTPTVLEDSSAGDPFDRTHLKVTVHWNEGTDSEREVFLESWVAQ
jgi:hypothetical protein